MYDSNVQPEASRAPRLPIDLIPDRGYYTRILQNMQTYYKIPVDELKKITNQCIGRLLTNLGDTIPVVAVKEIKHQIRLLELNIRNNIINNKDQSNGNTTK